MLGEHGAMRFREDACAVCFVTADITGVRELAKKGIGKSLKAPSLL